MLKRVYSRISGSVRDRLLLNSVSWVAARTVSGLTRLGILLAIARIYGPRSFGQISLSLSLVEILRTFSEFGIDTISVRKFVQSAPENRMSILARIAGAKVILAASFYCLGGSILFFMARQRLELYLGAELGLSLFFAGILGTLSSYFQSSFSMARIFKATIVSSLISIAFASIAIRYKATALVSLAALPLADCVNLFLVWLRSGVPLRLKFGLREPIEILRESLPVGLTAIFVAMYFRVDNLLLFKFAGASALGLYAASYRMVEPALMVPISFSSTTYSVLSDQQKQAVGAREVARIVLRTMWPAYIFITLVSAVLFSCGQLFLRRLLPSYLPAYPIIIVLAVALMVRSINVGLTSVLNSRARYTTLARISAGTLLANVLFISVMVPSWGAVGAAWAAVLTEMLNCILQARGLSLLFVSAEIQPALQKAVSTD